MFFCTWISNHNKRNILKLAQHYQGVIDLNSYIEKHTWTALQSTTPTQFFFQSDTFEQNQVYYCVLFTGLPHYFCSNTIELGCIFYQLHNSWTSVVYIWNPIKCQRWAERRFDIKEWERERRSFLKWGAEARAPLLIWRAAWSFTALCSRSFF